MEVTNNMSLISMVRISKRYGNGETLTIALNNINLDIEKGSMIAVMGTSGSGKSTLLNILGCLDTPSEGKYFLDGLQVSDLSKYELAKIRNQKIGFVFQQFALLNEYTALENVQMPIVYSNFFKGFKEKIPSRKIRELAVKKLTDVGLDKHLNKRPSQLSGGQQQRVAIARALINNPEIILADEPTGALDSSTSKEIIGILKELNKNGKTIIIITHDSNVATNCKKIINIKDGMIYS